MSVWYCIPSKRTQGETEPVLRQWKESGYKIALWVDSLTPGVSSSPYVSNGLANYVSDNFSCDYLGYAHAVNELVRWVLAHDKSAEWLVTGGDDMPPDPNKRADEIAFECGRFFGEKQQNFRMEHIVGSDPLPPQPSARNYWSTFGVMQPTGDRWLVNGPNTKPGSECVAGSPWMGREFCRRMYGGRGPLCEEYFHCGEDEELQEVATMLGVFWQRPDLTHYHNHWGRPREGERLAPNSRMPEFLRRANSREEWQKMKATLARRKAAGWPGYEPIA